MRRWNGWGDDTIEAPIAENVLCFLEEHVGQGVPQANTTLDELIRTVPTSRLSQTHPLITTDALQRIQHARGQSFPDWVALNHGYGLNCADGVAFPESADDITTLIQHAHENELNVIPYGGGTSVVGHINPLLSERPNITLDMRKMRALTGLSHDDQLAEFEAGVSGPDLESQLHACGFTLGHFPQSFEYSTLGGWVVTRSSGQQSLYYGRIEQLFAGGNVITPLGNISTPTFPASSAGIDVKDMILGSEGRFGILTNATIKITPIPEFEGFYAIFFPNWEAGLATTKQLVQTRLPLSMLRLSHATETATNLLLAGNNKLLQLLKKYLSLRQLGDDKCLLLFGLTGHKKTCQQVKNEVLRISKHHHGVYVGQSFGDKWKKHRFYNPYLRNTLWQMGYGVDTLETATRWENVSQMQQNVEHAIRFASESFNERVHVFTHLSHAYPHGSSVYTTYIFRLAQTPEETLARWQAMKHAASKAIIETDGTISHQHGIGTDHIPYLHAEKGELGLSTLAQLCQHFDPKGIMNPGKLIDNT